ncbi:MAG: hypothetical protein J5I94_03695, partial [Phaeodactylibacter sp.]|nr:hypothetical protein [Phaeodactylibacter sp.]
KGLGFVSGAPDSHGAFYAWLEGGVALRRAARDGRDTKRPGIAPTNIILAGFSGGAIRSMPQVKVPYFWTGARASKSANMIDSAGLEARAPVSLQYKFSICGAIGAPSNVKFL